MSEVKQASVIINPGDWERPQCGTANQHRAIVRIAKTLAYDSLMDFLMHWRSYNKLKKPDGSLDPWPASLVFDHQRRRMILHKGIHEQKKRRLQEPSITKVTPPPDSASRG